MLRPSFLLGRSRNQKNSDSRSSAASSGRRAAAPVGNTRRAPSAAPGSLPEPTAADPQPTIQRLIIIHLNLVEISTGNSALDEGASEEEVAESILYYCRTSGKTSSSSRTGSIRREAIQFAGLCSALYSIPSAIDQDKLENDRTKEVFLENCSLVFEPLECDDSAGADPYTHAGGVWPAILAVAQVSRRRPQQQPPTPGSNIKGNGGTPAAVGSALRRSHRLFSLLRKGGIHARLLVPPSQSATRKQPSDGCAYGEMRRLYERLKQLRTVRETALRRNENEISVCDSTAAASNLQRELDELRTHLPITSLKQDLKIHYDAFLSDMAGLASESGGAAYRSLVERIPAPINTGENSWWSSSGAQPSFRCIETKLSARAPGEMTALLRHFLENAEHVMPIGAVSVFGNGKLLATEYATEKEKAVGAIVARTASLLMWYLSSFRCKMRNQAVDTRTPKPCRTGSSRMQKTLRPLALSLGTDLDIGDDPIRPSSRTSRFMTAPPLSSLSTSDEVNAICGPSGERVWAPRIRLPMQRGGGTHFLDARVCLYDAQRASFLLYLADGSDAEEGSSLYQKVLQSFDNLVRAYEEKESFRSPPSISDNATGAKIQIDRRQQETQHGGDSLEADPGQDFIIVDRANESSSIFLHSANAQNDFDFDVSLSAESAETGRLNIMKAVGKSIPGQREPGIGEEGGQLTYDTRYQLASDLSLDCLLAFDEAISEMRNSDRKKGRPLTQLCTLLPHRWVYACADDTHELYALFDPKRYVTVADVQNAVDRIHAAMKRFGLYGGTMEEGT